MQSFNWRVFQRLVEGFFEVDDEFTWDEMHKCDRNSGCE